MATSEIEETMKRLTKHKGVQSVIIYNTDGIVIRSTNNLTHYETCTHVATLDPLIHKVKQLVNRLGDEFSNIRLRSHKNEILVYPAQDYTLVVVQDGHA